MAIVVLFLWVLTAGAGIYLLVTSGLGRYRSASGGERAARQAAPAGAHAEAVGSPAGAVGSLAGAVGSSAGSAVSPAGTTVAGTTVAGPAGNGPVAGTIAPDAGRGETAAAAPLSERAAKRQAKKAARARFDPPSLVRAKSQPALPDLHSLLEFLHPAFAITGLGFWLGYTLIHYRLLAWIAFGLITFTACAGLAWLRANLRAASRRAEGEPGPTFTLRLIVLHGAAAAVTFTLAALTALTARG